MPRTAPTSAPHWHTPCESGASCIQVARDPADDMILIRDSKDPHGPVLRFDRAEWDGFAAAVRDGTADRMLGT